MAAVHVDQLVTLNQLRPMSPRLTCYLPWPRGNLLRMSQNRLLNSKRGFLGWDTPHACSLTVATNNYC